MRNEFRGYYRPTNEEFDEMWRNGLFVLDASVLLDLYRYSRKTRAEFFEILRVLKERLWIPHQAACEFFENRLSVIRRQRDEYTQLQNSLGKAKRSIESQVNTLHRDPGPEAEQLVEKVNSKLDELANYVEKLRDESISESNSPEDDEVLKFVSQLPIGDLYPVEKEQEIFKEGERRYKDEVPPGYADEGKKKGSQKFGDLLVWFQILDKAEELRQPIILITDDRKDDWWLKVPKSPASPEMTIGPRPELIYEIHERSGTHFYMYLPDRFMKQAKDRLEQEIEISDASIDEVQELRQREEAEAEAREYTPAMEPAASATLGGAPVSPGTLSPDLSATQEALAQLNSPDARAARAFLNGPEAQEARRLMNSPEVQETIRQLNKPEIQEHLRWLRGW